MVVCFEVILDQKEEGISLTEIMPDGSRDRSMCESESISEISKMWEDFRIHRLDSLLKPIGERLFSLINGDRQLLMRALQEASARGERLQVVIRSSGLPDLPFELLYSSEFLAIDKIDIIRRMSNWGSEKSPKVENRPLTVLFMACSPEGLPPVLFYEKEEDTILEATFGLSAEIDVEDTGSLDGLRQRLTNSQYDVIHLSSHANITPEGKPFFWMEDEEGSPVKVTPSELWEILELNVPRIVFLSGCRTGQTSAALYSFAQRLVENYRFRLGASNFRLWRH
jgi:hypothetical protein